MRRIALLVVALPAAAVAEPRIEECVIDLPATEAAEVRIVSDGDPIRRITTMQYGETLRQEMDIVPLSGGDAELEFRVIRYSRSIVDSEPGPFSQTLDDGGHAIVRDGVICAEDACFRVFGDLTREDAQSLYDLFVAEFPDRSDCAQIYPG
jgi:hypothetical protein